MSADKVVSGAKLKAKFRQQEVTGDAEEKAWVCVCRQ